MVRFWDNGVFRPLSKFVEFVGVILYSTRMTNKQTDHIDDASGSTKDAISENLPPLFKSERVTCVVIILISLLLFLPGFFTTPPLDRDESRFAQASKQMLESGDYIDIRFQDKARHKKPIGIYWMQVAAAKISGLDAASPIWIYRIPSLLGAILTILAVFWCARAFTGTTEAFLASLLVASSILLGGEARMAKTDAVLLFCIVMAQGALARIWLCKDTLKPLGLAIIFWTAFSVSVLVKGPVGPMVLLLTILGLCLIERRFRWLRQLMPVTGLVLSAIVILPWFIAITVVTEGAFFTESVLNDLLGKVGQGQESHGAPPLTHLVAMQATFWPLSAFAILAIPTIVRNWNKSVFIFMIAWAVPTWIIFELVVTKLPHYTLPIMPAVAIATIVALSLGQYIWSIGRWIGMLLILLVPIAFIIISVGAPIYLGSNLSLLGIAICLIGILVATIPARLIIQNSQLSKAVVTAVASSFIVYTGTWGLTLPAIDPIWISTRLTDKIQQVVSCENPEIGSTGYSEPSFIFLTDTNTKLRTVGGIASWLENPGCKVAVVEESQLEKFMRLIANLELKVEKKAMLTGFNYNGGNQLTLHIFQSES